MSKTMNRTSPEVRDRAVRMVGALRSAEHWAPGKMVGYLMALTQARAGLSDFRLFEREFHAPCLAVCACIIRAPRDRYPKGRDSGS